MTNIINKENTIALGVAVAMAVGVSVAWYFPQASRRNELQSRTATERARLTEDVQRARVVPEIARKVEAMKKRYRGWDVKLPRKQELGPFLRDISSHLSDEELSREVVIKPGNPSRGELFNTLPIQMKFTGGYLSLASFLQSIEKMERLTRINKLTVKQNEVEESLEIDVEMNIYFTES
ncbi:MAG: type 4a pilus biogenesis protein PilO [Phycisphaerae bacterium]